MSTYADIKSIFIAAATEIGMTFQTSDGFEILKQSEEFEQTKYYILQDVSDLTSNNSFNSGGNISNSYVIDLWFLKPVVKDDNQDDLDTVYSELKSLSNEFMFELNKAVIEYFRIESWTDTRSKITDNNILALNVKFTLKTNNNKACVGR